jgi:hypothetical protein
MFASWAARTASDNREALVRARSALYRVVRAVITRRSSGRHITALDRQREASGTPATGGASAGRLPREWPGDSLSTGRRRATWFGAE